MTEPFVRKESTRDAKRENPKTCLQGGDASQTPVHGLAAFQGEAGEQSQGEVEGSSSCQKVGGLEERVGS